MELPTTLYVKVEKDREPEDDFLMASGDASDLSESETVVKVGVYKLTEEVELRNLTTIHAIK